MNSNRIFLHTAATIAVALGCSFAQATPIHGDTNGLASPATTITFDEPTTLSRDDLVTNQYASRGVTFDTGLYFSPDDPDAQYYTPQIDGHFLGNYPTGQFPATLNSIKLVFSSQQSGAAFALAANYSEFTFEAFLGNTSVESYTDTVNLGYYGFTDVIFDSIVITSLGSPYADFTGFPDSFDFDNLQFTAAPLDPNGTNAPNAPNGAIPEPETVALLGLGMLGAVACRRRSRKAA